VVDDIFRMPRTMADLAVVQFFSWFALFAMWIYTTAAVTSVHYGSSDPTSAAYNAGADWVGVLFGVYNGVAALAAFAIPVVARRTGRKGAHALNLLLGAAGFAGIFLIRDPQLLWLPMIGVGIAWASILSMPYAILSGALPARKMGVYMGVFNIFIVLPQLVAATLLGLVLKYLFDGQAIYALLIGAIAFVLAALAALRVREH
jgi:maltose/moltooligosaccharide transporter